MDDCHEVCTKYSDVYFVQQRNPSEGSEGVIQASERVSEEMQEGAKAGDTSQTSGMLCLHNDNVN